MSNPRLPQVTSRNVSRHGILIGPSIALHDRPAAAGSKISCLACRAVKRKCLTNDINSTCRRCMKQDLVCEYQDHRRGRKRKHPSDVPVKTTVARTRPNNEHSGSPTKMQLDPRSNTNSQGVSSGPSRAPITQASDSSSALTLHSNEAVIGDADHNFDLNTGHDITSGHSHQSGGAYGTFMMDPSAYYPYDVPSIPSNHPSRHASPFEEMIPMRLPAAGPSSYGIPHAPTSATNNVGGSGIPRAGVEGPVNHQTIPSSGLPTSMQDYGRRDSISRPQPARQPLPAPGRSSDKSKAFEIKFSHVIPDEGDSSPFLPPRKTGDQPANQNTTLERSVQPQDGLDPIRAGILHEIDVDELFRFYFQRLNVTVAVLDPFIHTPSYCRERSPFLFTAILTVASKTVRTSVYPSCLTLANRLFGRICELGLVSLEIVQALNVLTHWKKADDMSSWTRIGLAIRMAQELRLNVRGKRPLPGSERQAREILNRERAWWNLIVADYHLAIHHSSPRMITGEDINDPTDWLIEHSHLDCPGESSLGPLIKFSRMCRLYAEMLASMSDNPSNMRQLEWLELEWTRWRSSWADETSKLTFLPEQISTFKLCDSYFRFHIAEYRLLYTARYRSKGEILDTKEPTALSFAYNDCVDAALGLASLFQTVFVGNQYLPYCFNLVWVSLAVTSIWLVKNMAAMEPTDRNRVLRSLSETQFAAEQASRSADDMAAYMDRLLKHLLNDVSSDWKMLSYASGPLNPAATGVEGTDQGGQSMEHVPTAQQVIQEYFWSHPVTLSNGTEIHFPGTAVPTVDNPHGFDLSAGNNRNYVDHMNAGEPQHQMPSYGGFAKLPLMAPNGAESNGVYDALFPAADDDFWKALFPVSDPMGETTSRDFGNIPGR